MKKNLLSFIFILILFVSAFIYTYAEESPTTNIGGPEILRTEDTLTVIYSAQNIQCSGFQGILTYNSDLMLLSDAKTFDSNWNVEVMPKGVFLAYSKSPADSDNFFNGGNVFSLTFTLKNNVKEGDILSVGITSVIAVTVSPNGDSEVAMPDTFYSKKIDPPASSNADLSELGILGSSFSPAFSPDVTEYSIPLGVDFSVNSLNITARTAHEKATVEIINNELSVGNNIVTVKITAEDGTQKEYFIKVKKAHDPSKPLSNDTRLSQLTISVGTLSPNFSPDVRQYAVYLPYGTDIIDIVALPYNEFAQDIEPITQNLKEGLNIIKIRCIAEDFSEEEYILNIYVMPEYLGFVPNITNKIILSGSVTIDGILNIGETIKASLEGHDESAYSVTWYRNGEKVSDEAVYTLSEYDINTVIYAKITGIGDYQGHFISNKMYMTMEGLLVDADYYITEPVESFNMGLAIMIGLVCAALFLGLGLFLGNLKKGS